MDTLETYALSMITIISLIFAVLMWYSLNIAWLIYALLIPLASYAILKIGKLVIDMFSIIGVSVVITLNYMGVLFRFYGIPYYDILVHSLGGFFLAYLIFFKIDHLSFIKKKSKHLQFLGFVTICVVFFLGYTVELAEFLGDAWYYDIYRETLANSLRDQIVNGIGGTLGAYFAYKIH